MEKKTEQQTAPSSSINFQKCEELEDQILEFLNNGHLHSLEVVYLLALLLKDVGYSIDKIEYHDAARLRKAYLANPTLGLALQVLSSDIMQDWLNIIWKTKEKEKE